MDKLIAHFKNYIEQTFSHELDAEAIEQIKTLNRNEREELKSRLFMKPGYCKENTTVDNPFFGWNFALLNWKNTPSVFIKLILVREQIFAKQLPT